MSLNVNVQGGTGGGKKKPMEDQPDRWECLCPLPPPTRPCGGGDPMLPKTNPGYLVRCPDCKAERPS